VESLEMPIAEWPVQSDAAPDALSHLHDTHVARRMSAYDVDGQFIEPQDYENQLRGALAVMRFTMEKYTMYSGKGKDRETRDIYVANVASIRVLVPPTMATNDSESKTLHRKDPFTPDVKGKKRKIV
jgi:hypothetical protein